jgi:hypothetical protein
MKFILFLLTAASALRIESFHTKCFWVTTCQEKHAQLLEQKINEKPGYVSHSTTLSKYTLHTNIVFKS